jgi:hypothetical protein
MEIDKILSYLSYPSKNSETQPEIAGTEIPKSGKLYKMLSNIFDKSYIECKTPIIFMPEEGKKQNNECRNDIITFIKKNSIPNGRNIAQRLQSITSKISGMGLLFLILAKMDKKVRLLISRFPADQGIMVEPKSKNLKVEFVEQVFLKNANSYKSVVYEGSSFTSDFWIGNAVDKQTNHGLKVVANYWIRDFLLSDFQTTSKQGSKNLAVALRGALKNTDDMSVKSEITGSALLSKNLTNKNISIYKYFDQFNLSEKAKKVISQQLKSTRLLNAQFQFDYSEFSKHLSYKSLELDNGAMLTATIDTFDKCFIQEQIEQDKILFQTKGKIIDERLRKVK